MAQATTSRRLPSAAHCDLLASGSRSERAAAALRRPAQTFRSGRRLCRPARLLRARAAAGTEEGAPPAAATAPGLGEPLFERQHPAGTLAVRAARVEDVGPASVLLTRAFAGSLQGVPIQDARKYALECLSQPPRGMLLVARLTPNDPSLLPPGQDSRVVATTGLSFTRDTREDFPSLQPPDNAVYLSNMAVEAKLRRQGFARLMLEAAEALVAARGCADIYLHARLGDAPAQQLYLSAGYQVVRQDNSILARLRNVTPRALMCKRLPVPAAR